MRGRPIGGLRWLRNERLRRSRRKRLRARWRRGPRSERPPSAPRRVPRKHLGKRRVKRLPPGARERRHANQPLRGLAAPALPVLPKPSLRRTSPRCWVVSPLRELGSTTREKRNRARFVLDHKVEQAADRKIVRLFAFCGSTSETRRVAAG